MKETFSPENFKLKDTIILNGQIGYVETHDDADEIIGIKRVEKIRRLDGSFKETVVDSFAFSKEMEERVGWRNNYASIQMLTGDTPIDMDNLDETRIVSMMGEIESKYYHCYSELTGYLWTTEEYKCGGHDLLQILRSHVGEYVHIEIDLYERIK